MQMKDLLLVVNEILDGDNIGSLEFKMKYGSEQLLEQCLYDVAKQTPVVKDIIIDVATRLYCDRQKRSGNKVTA